MRLSRGQRRCSGIRRGQRPPFTSKCIVSAAIAAFCIGNDLAGGVALLVHRVRQAASAIVEMPLALMVACCANAIGVAALVTTRGGVVVRLIGAL